MKSIFFLIVSIFIFSQAYAGGCLPGDPCYYAGKSSPAMADVEKPSDRATMYATIGGGWIAMEKDQEILGHQIYEAKLGAYHFAPNWSAEVGFGFLPDIRNRQFPGAGRFALPEDTSGVRLTTDLLYHFDENGADKTFDPYAAVGAGVVWYDDKLKNGNSDVFGGIGFGTFIDLGDNFFLKPDYRANVVGGNTEINQVATIALGYKFCY